MPSSPAKKRLEIHEDLYEMLHKEARYLFISPSSLAALLIREGLDRLERLSPPAQPRISPDFTLVRPGENAAHFAGASDAREDGR